VAPEAPGRSSRREPPLRQAGAEQPVAAEPRRYPESPFGQEAPDWPESLFGQEPPGWQEPPGSYEAPGKAARLRPPAGTAQPAAGTPGGQARDSGWRGVASPPEPAGGRPHPFLDRVFGAAADGEARTDGAGRPLSAADPPGNGPSARVRAWIWLAFGAATIILIIIGFIAVPK
jgi:hypothetical protein